MSEYGTSFFISTNDGCAIKSQILTQINDFNGFRCAFYLFIPFQFSHILCLNFYCQLLKSMCGSDYYCGCCCICNTDVIKFPFAIVLKIENSECLCAKLVSTVCRISMFMDANTVNTSMREADKWVLNMNTEHHSSL